MNIKIFRQEEVNFSRRRKKQICFFLRVIVVFWFFSIMPPNSYANRKVKNPNVSGQFYSQNPEQLSAHVSHFLSAANVAPYEENIKIIISPHAGYLYSGSVAAHGFKAASKHQYKTIIILAPSHYLPFNGFSVGMFDSFRTPLGEVDVDVPFAEKLINQSPKIAFEPKAFDQEHSLEVQIPFLQKVFKDFKIVPVIIGRPSLSDLKEFSLSLVKIIGERKDVLMVVSTDMSHFHSDPLAREIDSRTMDAVKRFEADEVYKACQLGTMELCGVYPVVAALNFAKAKGINTIDILKYTNSSEISGDYDRVVGYFSAVLYASKKKTKEDSLKISKGETTKDIEEGLTDARKKRLLEIARMTMETYVKTGKVYDVQERDSRLHSEEGAFVTIHKKGQLRGCIGNIIGRGPLYLTVRDMAIAAASQDPRFTPVTMEELKEIDVEVSVLSKPRVAKNVDEIIMGKHGVIVSRGPFHQGVFLPQVADSTGWSREVFLSQLCSQKAGLAADAWKDPKTKLEIFTADVFSEQDFE